MVRIPAEMRERGKDAPVQVLLHDLSASGASVHTRSLLPIQLEVRLRFRLPAERAPEDRAGIEVDCLVVRNAALSSPDRGLAFVAGLHFLNLDRDAFQSVNAFVWRLLEKTAPAG
jgi:c-di-GMP-binding flagellar brake protein YcgR